MNEAEKREPIEKTVIDFKPLFGKKFSETLKGHKVFNNREILRRGGLTFGESIIYTIVSKRNLLDKYSGSNQRDLIYNYTAQETIRNFLGRKIFHKHVYS